MGQWGIMGHLYIDILNFSLSSEILKPNFKVITVSNVFKSNKKRTNVFANFSNYNHKR